MELVRCGFVKNKPSGIDSLAFSHKGSLLAVGRTEGIIEIFDTTTWHLVKRICGEGPLSSVRSLCWTPDDRLFSAGIHGEITEWDLQHLCPKYVQPCGGGAVWSMCYVENVGHRGASFFVACDDGVLRWFVHDGERLELRKSARASQQRLLSVVYTGKYLFTGDSVGVVQRWSLPDLACDAKMTLNRGVSKPPVVWALSCVHNGEEVVSGDSLGNVTWWDVATCTQLRTLCEHQADVLCLATVATGAREDEIVISSGVDAKISMYSARNEEGSWMFHNAVFGHTHDIRALAVDFRGTIVSGGVDATLSVQQTWASKPILVAPFSLPMSVSLSETSVALIQHDAHAEIWYLHPAEGAPDDAKARLKRLKVEDPNRTTKITAPNRLLKPQKLIDVSLATKGHLTSSAVSSDSSCFALSNRNGTRIFALTLEELEVRRIAIRGDEDGYRDDDPSSCLLFTGPHTLVAASLKTFEVIVIDTRTCSVQARFTNHDACVNHLATWCEWLCSSDVDGQIHLYNLDTLEHYCKVPSFDKGFPTCVSITKTQKPQIIAVSSYHQLLVFDIDTCNVQTMISIPVHVLRPHHRICGAIPHPQEPEKILFWSPIGLVKANLSVKDDDIGSDEKELDSEKENVDVNRRATKKKNLCFSADVKPWQIERRFWWIQSVLEIPWSLKKRSLLMFEVTPDHLQSLLPTQFIRRTYGS